MELKLNATLVSTYTQLVRLIHYWRELSLRPFPSACVCWREYTHVFHRNATNSSKIISDSSVLHKFESHSKALCLLRAAQRS